MTMVKEQVIGSYIIRFTKSKHQQITSQAKAITITLQDIKTGERLEFETWLSAWAFLEEVLEEHEVAEDGLLSKQAPSVFKSSDSVGLSVSTLQKLQSPYKKARQPVTSNSLKEMLSPVS